MTTVPGMTTISASWSGQHAHWDSHRDIHVWKFCRRAVVRGLKEAVADGPIKEMVVELDGTKLKFAYDYTISCEGSHIHFSKHLLPHKVKSRYFLCRWLFSAFSAPRTFCLNVHIVYDRLDPVVYGR